MWLSYITKKASTAKKGLA